MGRVATVAVVVAAIVVVWAAPGLPDAIRIGDDEDLCAAINALNPGQELVLRPGEYRGPCTIRKGGTPGSPVVIRGEDGEARPRVVYDGTAANVLEVKADHVIIRGLAFGPTRRDIDGIRIFGRRDITVENCEFSHLGGIAVVANHNSIDGLVVRHNIIRDSGATAMYFGCHDGAGCVASRLLVERNYIHGVRAPEPEIGYGIQVKLNSTGIIRDNVIAYTKGPGIMVYGAADVSRASLVERNLVMGSARSAGIVVGGGPAVVRNNITAANAEGGIALVDYGKRQLLRMIVVAHNSLHGNGVAGILVPTDGFTEAVIANNAVQPRPGTPGLPGRRPGLFVLGNVECGVLRCFADPERGDFSPAEGAGAAFLKGVSQEGWTPADDFLGRARGVVPTVGALEGASGPLALGVKPVIPSVGVPESAPTTR